MRVELSADTFDGDGYELLVILVHYFLEGRHDWVVVDPADLDVMDAYFQKHAPTRAADWSELARLGLASQEWTSTAPQPPDVTVTRENLSDLVHDLGASARVVVENREGDRDFLLAVAHVFGAQTIIDACEQRWLKFVQGGGSGEVPKVVRDEATEFRHLKRVVFLLDSDRWTPTEPSKHEQVVAELRAEGICGHILHFREVENYVPNHVLAAVTVPKQQRGEHDKRMQSLRTLIPEQRAYFDMKKGFQARKTPGPEVPSEQQELYASLPGTTVVALRKGFGDDLTGLLLQEAKAGKLKERDFAELGSGVCDELREILALIDRII
ncbi:hypothetical protein [Actinomadura hibisca]|uniref:hypothetical protein n=1 Tax=Actinomadura hibisca TaxID=68565 RepID=UPI0008334EF0|nr:hypothetical protein [Actinomadura hibisca]